MDGILAVFQNNWYEILTTVLSLGFFLKYVVVRRVVGEFADFLKVKVEARRNGQITDAEYALIGKKAVALTDTLWGVIVGLFPNKSKL
jgi:hypothetical protein